MPFRHAASLVLALAVCACDPADGSAPEEVVDDDDDTPTGEDPPPSDDPVDVDEEVAAVHALPQAVADEGATSASIAAEAVFLASQTVGSGQVVTTGTLTQDGDVFRWAAMPSDRMVVEFADGTDVELWVGEIAGDPTSAAAFLDGEHRFTYRVAVEDRVDMTFTSVKQGGEMAASADGRYVYGGRDYDVDLARAGTYAFEVDSTGSYFFDRHRTTGTIAADEFDLDVDESWSFELVTSDTGSAQATERRLASSLQLGEDVYDWVDVVVRKNFLDGKVSELDTYWTADGDILRNGEAYGAYRLGSTSTLDFITVLLDLPDGEIELERIAAY